MNGEYYIEHADVHSAQHAVLELAQGSLSDLGRTVYEKYYLNNPSGEATLLLARPRHRADPVGMVALFPWPLLIDGVQRRGLLVGGYAVGQKHRGLGPAIALQRAALSSARDAGAAFIYGATNHAALPVFKRLGYTVGAPFTRLVRPVSVEAAARLGGRFRLGSQVSAVVDPLLLAVAPERWRGRWAPGAVVEIEQFDETYESLWRAVCTSRLICGARTPSLLNWRLGYRCEERTTEHFSGIALMRDRPVAYMVWYTSDRVRQVVDAAAHRVADLRRLVSTVLLDSRRSGELAVSVAISGEDKILMEALRGMGFMSWGSKLTSVFHPLSAEGSRMRTVGSASWRLLLADTDL